jgi:hypothetical protein
MIAGLHVARLKELEKDVVALKSSGTVAVIVFVNEIVLRYYLCLVVAPSISEMETLFMLRVTSDE